MMTCSKSLFAFNHTWPNYALDVPDLFFADLLICCFNLIDLISAATAFNDKCLASLGFLMFLFSFFSPLLHTLSSW